MRKTIHYPVCGLEYVFLKNAPIKQTRHGPALDANIGDIEKQIACEIIIQGIPLRGAEVMFLRKSIGLSLEKFADLLDLSAPAILKWERATSKRLSRINEVAVRALMAEELGVSVEGTFSGLVGMEHTPAKMMLKVA